VEFLAGSYHIDQEVRMPFEGGEVLYLVGMTSTITSCCGTASPFSFIKIVGRISSWQDNRDAKGLPVSQIELVRDAALQDRLKDEIQLKHPDIERLRIEFW